MLDELREILNAAGIPAAETFHQHQPDGAFLAWGERITADGADDWNGLYHHEITIELYEPGDCAYPEAHQLLQNALDNAAVRWTKEPRIWLLDLQLFSTTYTFSMTERRSS